MGVKKVRLMITNEDGTEEQVYPITSLDAIDGLEEALANEELKIGVMSINEKTGDITLPVFDEEEYAKIVELLDAYEKGEISGEKGDKGDKGEPGKDGAGVQNIKLRRAWAWNENGTDRFMTVYPNENLIIGQNNKVITRTVGPYWLLAYTFKKEEYPELFNSDYITFSSDLVTSENNDGVTIRINTYVEGNVNYDEVIADNITIGSRGAVSYKLNQSKKYTRIELAYANIKSGGAAYIFEVKNEKLELSSTATPYTPSPIDDFDGAYPSHEGLYFGFDDDPSDDPTNYKPFVRILGEKGETGTDKESEE